MGGLQNRDAARRLANGGSELVRNVRKEFRKNAQRVARETQARILSATATRPPPPGVVPGMLRAEIAATVSIRTHDKPQGTQAEIRSDGNRMPHGAENLPAYANAGQARWRRWRHPVYGRSDQERSEWTWVTQDWPSAHGWFDGTIRGNAQSFTDAAEVAIRETSAYLEGHG